MLEELNLVELAWKQGGGTSGALPGLDGNSSE